MYTPQVYRPVSRKRMNSPIQRGLVRHDLGLGEVDGLFNIGKMFSRLTHFTPSSLKLSNIMGAIGSVTAFTVTGGLSTLLPKVSGAHSALMKDVGIATVAVAAVAGGAALLPAGALSSGAGAVATSGVGIGTPAAGSSTIAAALAPEASGGFFSAIGSGLSTVGSGLMTAVQALPLIGSVMGGGQQAQDFGPAQPTADQIAAQAAYDAQVRAQQAAMYQPGYAPSIPYVTDQYAGAGTAPSMDTSYGDLRSPYTAITEDGQQVQIDPTTGQVITAGVSNTAVIAIGGVVFALLGWYYFTPSSKSDN